MNRSELEAAIARRTKVAPKVVAQVLSAAFTQIAESLSRGEKVTQTGFGSFEVVETPRRKGRGVLLDDAGRQVSRKCVSFRAGRGLEAVMNDKIEA